jgi:hypothetical protein
VAAFDQQVILELLDRHWLHNCCLVAGPCGVVAGEGLRRREPEVEHLMASYERGHRQQEKEIRT